MGEEHLPAVMAIEGESFPTPASRSLWLDELANPQARNLVAKRCTGGGWEVVGFVNFWLVAGEVQLNTIAVRQDCRGLGIGADLMQAMMDLAADEEIGTFTLEVRVSNVAAIHLYERFGFVVKGVRKGYYGETGEDALIMWVSPEGV